ncbi:hypothetical protein L6452_22333 [Arctium lappa]|uniref:Uncharacterized protein n=1 Tax=Arctium lappa TaxID=4217 RepID=A0ACB9B179_ARCLA|nr:hypothetical protein L6452_22333 [Arctium lappa]
MVGAPISAMDSSTRYIPPATAYATLSAAISTVQSYNSPSAPPPYSAMPQPYLAIPQPAPVRPSRLDVFFIAMSLLPVAPLVSLFLLLLFSGIPSPDPSPVNNDFSGPFVDIFFFGEEVNMILGEELNHILKTLLQSIVRTFSWLQTTSSRKTD